MYHKMFGSKADSRIMCSPPHQEFTHPRYISRSPGYWPRLPRTQSIT